MRQVRFAAGLLNVVVAGERIRRRARSPWMAGPSSGC
jgi:hypothetical protein